jgi:hypothetical protein
VSTARLPTQVADRNFSSKDLKELFQYNPLSTSTTAELMHAKQQGHAQAGSYDARRSGSEGGGGDGGAKSGACSGWGAYNASTIPSKVMRAVAQAVPSIITFVHSVSSKATPAADVAGTAAGACAKEAADPAGAAGSAPVQMEEPPSKVARRPSPGTGDGADEADDDLELDSDEDDL